VDVRPLILVFVLVASLAGCAKYTCTNRATIIVDGLPHRRSCPIVIDPSLNPVVNETQSTGLFWDTKQRVVINTLSPVKLIPSPPDDTNPDKVATRHTATIVINRPLAPPYPILIDPSLNPEVNETRRSWIPWKSGNEISQQIMLHRDCPLKLVPASLEEADAMIGAEKVARPSGKLPPP
jgi:hypothetical protein